MTQKQVESFQKIWFHPITAYFVIFASGIYVAKSGYEFGQWLRVIYP
jgi:hypothetical protein